MDIDAALKDGYSLEEVNQEAARRVKFDYSSAKKDGYSEEEIHQELRKRLGKPEEGFLSQLGKNTVGAAAAVGDIASGLIKMPLGIGMAVGGKLSDPSANLNVHREAGQQATEALFPSIGASTGLDQNPTYQMAMKPFELLGEGINKLGEGVEKVTGSKNAGGATKLGADIASIGIGIPGAKLAGKGFAKLAETVDPGLRNAGAMPPKPATAMQAQIDAKKAVAAEVTPEQQGQRAFSEMEGQLRNGENSPLDIRPKSSMESMVADLQLEPAREAQRVLEARQAEMEQEVARQTSLDMNAAERKRQENAPTGYEQWKQEKANQEGAQYVEQYKQVLQGVVDQLEALKTKYEEARAAGTSTEAIVGRIQELNKYLDKLDQEIGLERKQLDAQTVIEKRQTQLELDTKRQATLDFNAAERARQEQAGTGYEQWKQDQVAAKEQASTDHGQQFLEKGTQADIFEPYTNMHREFDQLGNERKQLSFDEFKQTVENLEKEPGTAFQRPEDIQAAYQQYKDSISEKQTGLFDQPSHPAEKAMAKDRIDTALQEKIDNHPIVRKAEEKVNKQSELVIKLGQMVEEGRVSQSQMARALADLANFETTASKARSNVQEGLKPLNQPIKSPFKGRGRKQAGALDASVINEGYRALTKALSRLTDRPWVKERFPADKYLTNSDGTPLVMLHGTVGKLRGPLTTTEQGLHLGFPASSHMFVQNGNTRMNKKATWRSDATRENAQLYPMTIKKGNYPFLKFDAGDWSPRGLVEKRNPFNRWLEVELANKGYSAEEISGFKNYVTNALGQVDANQRFTDVLRRIGVDGFFYVNQAEAPKHQRELALSDRKASVQRLLNDPIKNSLGNVTSFVTWDANKVSTLFDSSGEAPKKQEPSFNSRTRKQGGGLRIDWSEKPSAEQLSKVPGIKEKLGKLLPSKYHTAEELIQAVKDDGIGDAPWTTHSFEAGGLYHTLKTDHPVVQFIQEKITNADNQSKADTNQHVQSLLAPAIRDVPLKDKTTLAPDMIHAELSKVEITPEMMRDAGYTDKMIKAVETHRQVMDYAFDMLNRGRKAVGKEPIDKRIAYVTAIFSGDFRKPVMKGDEVVMMVGGNTRYQLNKAVEAIQAAHPEYSFGKEQWFGGKKDVTKTRQDSFAEAMKLVAEGNPDAKILLDTLGEFLDKDAYGFMNTKKHTLGKKGVEGSLGRESWKSAEENATNFFDAQLRYAQHAIEFGHMTEAMTEVNKVLASPEVQTKMPRVTEWAEQYRAQALGFNPKMLGQHLEAAFASFGEWSGIGTKYPKQYASAVRNATNMSLLAFSPAFLLTQKIQMFKAMPEINTYLATKGIKLGDPTGYTSLFEGALAHAEVAFNKEKASPELQSAYDYAKQNHVYGVDMIDHSMSSNRDLGFALSKSSRFATGAIEAVGRAAMYYGVVKKLNESGIMGKDSFTVAHKVTDMAFANYSPVQQAMVYKNLGPIGSMARNLTTFKHNELSRMAEFYAHSKPALAVGFITSVAFAGIYGFVAFQEADWIVRQMSKMMGNPTSLSKLVMDKSEELLGKHAAALTNGLGAYAGVDMSNRLGLQDVLPNSAGELVFPGGSKLVDAGKAVGGVLSNQDAGSLKELAMSIAPGGAKGMMDRAWMSKQTPQGELAFSAGKYEGKVYRNDADKAWKTLGFTGIHESTEKRRNYENTWTRLAYEDIRKTQVEKAARQMFMQGHVDTEILDKYLKADGDANSWASALEDIAKKQSMDEHTRDLLKSAMSQRISTLKHLERVTRNPK